MSNQENGVLPAPSAQDGGEGQSEVPTAPSTQGDDAGQSDVPPATPVGRQPRGYREGPSFAETAAEIGNVAVASQGPAGSAEAAGAAQAAAQGLVVAVKQRETVKKNTGNDRFGRRVREDACYGHYSQFDGGANIPLWVRVLEALIP